jgi:cytochrome P450
MFAGAETASHNLVVALYWLINPKNDLFHPNCEDNQTSNPRVLKKLMDELEDKGFKKFEDNFDLYTLQNISECDYLNYVVKECLRIDGPANQSLSYSTTEEITICGVKIPKGQEISYDIISTHYDENEWKEPFSFIPERFDPDSEYFLKPRSTSSRTALSFIPFSFGPRVCAGLSYAMLEMKVALIYILTHLEYTVDKEFLLREDVGFGISSHLELDFTVTKIKH